jgi:arabinofuranan 3-O-arabinosyltransferase
VRRPRLGPSTILAAEVAVLAFLAYVPALRAGAGRMPADTKLYLYLDPGRLVSDAPYTFDPRQFAGWVPHQTISYLWPSGPWFWLFDALRVPDWVAHRLWIGTILLAAGLGVRWAARHLGIVGGAAVAAAAVYQLSPYVLPYLSRTSLMLLPYAALGWIVGLTVLAATRTTWRHAALLALVVATVAAPNATAIAMIAPAPVLWLVHAAWAGDIAWRRAVTTAGRVALLSVLVSLWWLAMLAVQGRYGADVLAYSETLEAVSLTSLSTEALRGMGYWLFYVRDPVGFTTSAAEAYMSSGRWIVTSFLLAGVGLAGIAVVRFHARRFAVLLVIAGTVLAVGVHPIDDPSPLMSPFAGSSRSTLVLALRSSTRALPMSVLGLALGTGALVAAVARALRAKVGERVAWLPAAVVVVLAAANLPAAWNGGFVDNVISRDQDPPAAWLDAAAELDDLPEGYRVMQVPGSEFGAFTWGYTVDPPLPGLTDRPVVTRDLLPLGSPAAMDLLYALDDRFQQGIAEGGAIAPVARLFGVDTIWVPNDVWFDRFRTPRPEPVAALYASEPTGLEPPRTFGEPFTRDPVLEMVDEDALGDGRVGTTPLEPVWLVGVEEPVAVVRAKTDVVAVAGSGDGVVDAAAAGLLDGTELLRYTADRVPVDHEAGATPVRLVVTDSNRDRARQWRSSQDTHGFTEEGGDEPGVLRDDSADQRLSWASPDEPTDAATQTVALQEGPVHASASAYGEPFAYRPEDRAVMAVDGDPATAWRVADRADARGEHIDLVADSPVSRVTVLQPSTGSTGLAPNRWITAIDVAVDGGEPVRVELDDRSRAAADGPAPGQVVELPRAGTRIRLVVAATASTPASADATVPPGGDAVGFAELDTGLGPTIEVVRPPIDWIDGIAAGTPTDIVLTRERADATNRWRRDPEPVLVRDVVVPGRDHTVHATVRLDRRGTDAALAALFGWRGTVADARLTGVPAAGGWAATDGDPATSWISPFGAPTGAVLTVPTAPGIASIESLDVRQPAGTYSTITQVELTGDAGTTTVDVPPPDADGWSRLTFAPVRVDGVLTVAVSGAEQRTTRDRRSAELVTLPSAIAELRSEAIAPASLPATVALGCRDDLLTIDGAAVSLDLGTTDMSALMAGEPVEATTDACDTATIDAGDHRIVATSPTATGLHVDRLVLGDPTARAVDGGAVDGGAVDSGAVDARIERRGRTTRTVDVAACPQGCWLVLGEGHNTGWAASDSLEGDLGAPAVVDGGFNGWWLAPSAAPRTVELRWTPQRTVSIALVLSAVAVVGCIVLAVVDRRRRAVTVPRPPRFAGWGPDPRVAWWLPAIVTGGTALLVVDARWAIAGAVLGALAGWWRRPRALALAGFATWTVCGVVVLWRVHRDRPFPSAAWPGHFEDLHRPGMFVIALLAGSLVARDHPRRGAAARPGVPDTTDSISSS